MKILSSIDRCYQNQLELNEKLKKKVDEIFTTNKKERWHYFRRIKLKESFALKIETRRIEDPNLVNDFFACTLVVETIVEIKNAEKLVRDRFEIVDRKPKADYYTEKSPESFPFDDLRLYVKFKPDPSLPPEHIFNELSNVVFEVQIKTFLQHAWSIATYDLVYKGEDINWAEQRVAHQIKAMLEHAEISIQEIETIKKSDILAKENKKIKRLIHAKNFLTKNWSDETLPKDRIRLSKNVLDLLGCLNVTFEELQIHLNEETSEGRGVKTSNLSPYFIIIQTIINKNPQKIDNFMFKSDKKKIVLPSEIDTGSLEINERKIIRVR